MKICLINNLYKPFARGGAENIVELLASGLKKSGHEVFIITTRPIFKKLGTKSKRENIYYINSLYYNLAGTPILFRLFWHFFDMFDIGSYFIVKRILKKERPDIVMTHNLKGIGYLVPRAIKSLSIKHIHSLHDIQLLHPSGLLCYKKEEAVKNIMAKIYQSFCRFLFASPYIVISPSDWLLKIHTEKDFFRNSKKLVFPNPVSFLFSRENAPSQLKEDEKETFKFLYVGQIESHKGILFLIRTFKLLCDEYDGKKCELLILGHGSKIKKALRLSQDRENIKLLGFKKSEEVNIFMKEADCLVMPSLCYENSPTVIYEAFASGLPIIASKIGGVPELLSEGAGLMFEPENEGDLMYQMKWALNNTEKLRENAVRGKEKAERLNIDNYIKNLEKLF